MSTGWGFHGYGRLCFVSDVTTDSFLVVARVRIGRGGGLTRVYLHCSCLVFSIVARDSSVDIATRYWLFGPGVDSSRRRDFPHPSRPTVGSTERSVK